MHALRRFDDQLRSLKEADDERPGPVNQYGDCPSCAGAVLTTAWLRITVIVKVSDPGD